MTTEKNIGFLGCGNMARCIMAGMLSSGFASPDKVYICNRTEATNKQLVDTYKVTYAEATQLATVCDVVMLGVKPYGITSMLDLIAPTLNSDKLIISMAAGVTLDTMEKHAPSGAKIVRVMPNIPSFVGEGMTSVTPNKNVSEEETAFVVSLFSAVGKASVVAESAIHGVVGVAGSSPAYVFLFLEALADGAVRGGIPRKQAYEMAAQAVLGSAKMMMETGKSPGELKDMICSPGGTTIEAVRFLEKNGLRSAVIEGMVAAMEKSKAMEELYKE